MSQSLKITLLIISLLFQSLAHAEWSDISEQVAFSQSAPTFDRVNRVLYTIVEVHNNSGHAIYGPARLRVFDTSIPFSEPSSTNRDELQIEIPGVILDDESKSIRVDFQLFKGNLEFSLALEQYSFPPTSEFSLLFGGIGTDEITSSEVDHDGNLIIAGNTTSQNIGPVAYRFVTHSSDTNSETIGHSDAFVAKLSQSGELFWISYIGGEREENINDIALDDAGNIYATGSTYSYNYPTTENAFQRQPDGGRSTFVSVLNSSGDQLTYSTLITGNRWDYGFVIDVDTIGDIYVAGFTHGGYPTTPNAVQPDFGGSGDGFLAKIRPNELTTDLLFSTYLGGGSWESIDGFSIDDQGNVYIATHSLSPDFPTTPGVYDEICTNCGTSQKTEGAVAKISADGSQLLYSTMIGGNSQIGDFRVTGITVLEDHSVFVVGSTNQTDLLTTDNAIQRIYGGGASDIYMAHIDSEGKSLRFASYFGGNGNDRVSFYNSLRRDRTGRLYFSGTTSSSNLPVTNAVQSFHRGSNDAFAAVFNPTTDTIELVTYLGGNQEEGHDEGVGIDISVDMYHEGIFYLVGITGSSDFPIHHDILDSSNHGGDFDGFITKIDINESHCIGATCLFD
jgi:hypothetical protein